jgi:hypothetical protein
MSGFGEASPEQLAARAAEGDGAALTALVDPTHLLFAGRGEPASRRLPVLEAVGEMERLHEIAAIHQSHPRYRAPEGVAAEIKRVLQSAELRLLS